MAKLSAIDQIEVARHFKGSPAAFPVLNYEWGWLLLSGMCGAIVGFAAPGLEQWYLPWVAMSSLVILTALARHPWQASWRGFFFGTAYNLVYLSWFLTFRPAFCEGAFVSSPGFVAFAFWILVSAWLGVFVSVFTCLLRAIPLTGGWLPLKHQNRLHWPTFVVVPLLWILVDRLCNTTQLHGFPWAALHYSQYKQLAILQSAATIGGVGISAWIMLVSTNVAAFIGFGQSRLRSLTCGNMRSLALNTAFTALISLALLFFGASRLEQEKKFLPSKQKVIVTAMQASLSSKIHKADSVAIVDKYVKLAAQAPSGSICVWPEWSMPMNFSGNQKALEYASALPAARKQDWILGGCDKDAQGRTFNAVCAITREGKVLPEIYHKRYLVPLGEYTPGWIKETPLGVMLYGLNKRYSDTSSGSKAVVYDLGNIKVAPVICFESAYPKLCAQSVRSGGELLVDSSDNSWFCRSILSDQMVSFAVMRAIENHRSFVFSTAFGPSTIVDSSGHILRQAPHEELAGISCSVPVEHDTTAYSMWCF